MTKKYVLSVIMVLSLMVWLAPASDAAELTLTSAVNKAGRQRMLTQRIVKSYAQIGASVMIGLARKQLSDSLKLFSSQLTELKKFAVNSAAIEAISQIELTWRQFHPRAAGPVTPDSGRHLHKLGEELLVKSDKLVVILESLSNKPYAHLVNISGRQRMLSQRLAKLYFLEVWGIASPTDVAEFEQSKNEFKSALTALQSAPENSPQISDYLAAVNVQWNWFESVLEMGKTESFHLIIAETGEKLLISMDNITELYKNLSEN